MQLKSLHIIAFGGIRNRDISLSEGVNILEGMNESGKSSAAMFIKFVFYGLTSRSKGSVPSERQRYVNRSTAQAAGYIMAQTDGGILYRLERSLFLSDDAPPREMIRIVNQSTGETVTGQNPGDYFFGVPEDVFVSTCFISQSAVIKPDIAGIGYTSGAGIAVENLLTTADENVDLKKAVKKLDQTRRELCHKNGSGGEIGDLKEKRARYALELEESRDKAVEITSVSTSLDDIKGRIAELEEARERHEGIFAALEKITQKRRIDAAETTRTKQEKLLASLKALDESPLGSDFAESLAESEREIRAYDEACAAFDEREPAYEDVPASLPDPAEVMEEIRHTETTARMQFSVAIALLVAGVIGLGAALLLYVFNTDMYVLPLLFTLLLVSVGVAFIIKHAKTKSILNEQLDLWEAESTAELENAVLEKLQEMDRTRTLARERESALAALDTAKLRFDAAAARIRELASAANLSDTGDLYEILGTLHNEADRVKKEREQIVSRLDHLNGRLEVLNEQLDGVDVHTASLEAYTASETPLGKIAASLDAEGIQNAIRQREFTESALRSAIKRRSVLEEKLTELGRLPHSPDELTTMIVSIDERIEELSLRHAALEMAQEAITSAGEAMRSDIIPRIRSAASALMANATGIYTAVTLDNQFTCGLAAEDDIKTHDILSHGTADLAYISLRIALASEIFSKEAPIVVMDESFAHVDSRRIKNFLRLLGGSQFLVFTCRSEESDAARALGCNVIHLS